MCSSDLRSADELTLRVGPYRRNIVLPYALWNLKTSGARFEETKATLRIHFVKPGDTTPGETIPVTETRITAE